MATGPAADGVGGVVGSGAKIATALFETAAKLGSAGADLQAIAAETSLLCSMLRHLAQRKQASTQATGVINQVLRRSKDIFNELDGQLYRISRLSDWAARARCIREKTAKLHVQCATLECCKILLSLMLAVFDLAETIASQPKSSDASKDPIDSEGEPVVFTLITALRDSVQRLELLEEDEEAFVDRAEAFEDLDADYVDADEALQQEQAYPALSSSDPASVWLQSLPPYHFHTNDSTYGDPPESAAAAVASQLPKLLLIWADQRVPEPEPAKSPVEIFKGCCGRRGFLEETTAKVLPSAMKRYNLAGEATDYDLYALYEDKEHLLGPDEKPLILFKQLDREGRRPQFMLRRRDKRDPGRLPGTTIIVDNPLPKPKPDLPGGVL